MELLARRYRVLLAAMSAAILIASSSAVRAADLVDIETSAPVVSADTWSGFYGGIHGGAGAFTGLATDWSDDVFRDPSGDADLNGFAGLDGVQAGYNWQSGNAVWGLEADWAWTGFEENRYFNDPLGRGNPSSYVKAQMDWLATFRGRLGLASGNALAYVSGGLAVAQLEHCANNGLACSIDGNNNIAWNGTLPGLAASAGIETRLSDNWSLKGEYLFVQLDNENLVYNIERDYDIDFSDRAHIFRLGLNWHPNGLPLAAATPDGPWTGFYGGVHGGAGAFTGMATDWEDSIFDGPDGDFDLSAFAGLAGLQPVTTGRTVMPCTASRPTGPGPVSTRRGSSAGRLWANNISKPKWNGLPPCAAALASPPAIRLPMSPAA